MHLPRKTFDRITPYLSHTLVDDEQLAEMRQLHESLPDESCLATGFEIRLGAGEVHNRVDYFAAIDREGAAKLLRQSPPNPAQTSPADRIAWQRTRKFCETWQNPASALHTIPHVWLEFDQNRPRPAPSLLYAVARDADWSVHAQALDLLLEQPVLVKATLVRVCAALPPGAWLKHVGAMLPRGVNAVRAVCADLTAADLPAFLQQLEWPGQAAALDTVLQDYKSFLSQTLVDLDLSRRLDSALGIEFSFPAHESHRWPAFLSRLIDHGLCTREKADALAGWLGPRGLELPGVSQQMIWRTLNHIKLVLRDAHWQAKAYAGYIIGRRPNTLRRSAYELPARFSCAGGVASQPLYDYRPGPAPVAVP